MKILIGKPRNHWISPYTIKEKFFFWRKDYDAFLNEPPKILEKVCNGLRSVLDFIHPEIEYIKIDDHDVWSADYTLAKINYPVLVKLKESLHGAPHVDDIDVPDRLKSMNAPRVAPYETDEFFFERWDWCLDEMIFAFRSKVDTHDWMEQYKTGVADFIWVDTDVIYEGDTCKEMKRGPNHTLKYDWDGIRAYEARIQNGFRLFGKYYSSLWD